MLWCFLDHTLSDNSSGVCRGGGESVNCWFGEEKYDVRHPFSITPLLVACHLAFLAFSLACTSGSPVHMLDPGA